MKTSNAELLLAHVSGEWKSQVEIAHSEPRVPYDSALQTLRKLAALGTIERKRGKRAMSPSLYRLVRV